MVYVLDANTIILYLRGETNVCQNMQDAITAGHVMFCDDFILSLKSKYAGNKR